MRESLHLLLDWVLFFWPFVFTLIIILDVVATAHVILNKRDTRAVICWVGVIWLAPLFGWIFYLLLGINRIRRKAKRLRHPEQETRSPPSALECPLGSLQEKLGQGGKHLLRLQRLMQQVSDRPLLDGNAVSPLVHGDEAYPVMIEAIENARDSIMMSSYIFDYDLAGKRFLEAFLKAKKNGVEIRVLIDAVGARYSKPSMVKVLKEHGINAARFQPTMNPSRVWFANLRNHRKIMVIDGCLGFTGGINIREGCLLKETYSHQVQDLHFKLEGPVVAQLQEVLMTDWAFATHEHLEGDRWFPCLEPMGAVEASAITAGPDDDLEKIRTANVGAICTAERTLRIVTPYFLPDPGLIAALGVAALRGVEVDILIPETNNIAMVQWASTDLLWQVLERGCRVWLTSAPFDHTKLVLVDGQWSFFGSSNWDPRSLRLNFELNVQCYDRELAEKLENLVQSKIETAKQLTLEEVDGRRLPERLRDGMARLLSPYL